jgi:hypothetical protein
MSLRIFGDRRLSVMNEMPIVSVSGR